MFLTIGSYMPPSTVVQGLALAPRIPPSSVQRVPRGSSTSLSLLDLVAFASTSGPKMTANCSMKQPGKALRHPADEQHAPDSRWTLELNSSVIELKLKLSPCCSGPHLFRELGRSACRFQGSRAFVSRANEGARCGSPCRVCRSPSLPISASLTNYTCLQARPAVLDGPCPPNLVSPMLYVAAAAVTEVAHPSRRLY